MEFGEAVEDEFHCFGYGLGRFVISFVSFFFFCFGKGSYGGLKLTVPLVPSWGPANDTNTVAPHARTLSRVSGSPSVS